MCGFLQLSKLVCREFRLSMLRKRMSASSVIRDAMTSPVFERWESHHDEAAGASKQNNTL